METYLHYNTFSIPIYRGRLVVIISNTDVSHIIPNFDKTDDTYAHSYLDNYKNREAVFCLLNFSNKNRKITHGVIAHEALHLANYMAIRRGIALDVDNDEPIAYLVEWITDRIYEVCKKYYFTPK